jgi:hypothetical protein
MRASDSSRLSGTVSLCRSIRCTRVRFESVACLNPLLDESLLVVDPQAWFAARPWLTANPRSLARAESLDARALDALLIYARSV